MIEIIDTETEIEDDGADEETPFEYAISSYGADYPVDSLVKRIEAGDIYVPSFQRRYIWNATKASRFIESLLLGLPVPGIFLSKEKETQRLMVIDGQQRLRTLESFYNGKFPDGKRFALQDVQPQFGGITYDSLKSEDRRRLDDSILHATVIKQDEPSDDESSIYHVFERLNTGGILLRPQEIRACIYHGEFNDLLEQLNRNESWRSTYGKADRRMRDRELILRFFALYFNSENYKAPMKQFLNSYMSKNRHLKLVSDSKLSQTFENTIELVLEHLGSKAFKPRKGLNAAVFDAVMVGAARRLEKGEIRDSEALQKRYKSLLNDESFISTTAGGTSSEESVRRRLTLATKAFIDLE